jgi:hypothetical protein
MTLNCNFFDGSQNQLLTLDRFPDTCPNCHAAIEPIQLTASASFTNEAWGEMTFRCPRRTCQRIFIARYRKNRQSGWLFFEEAVPSTHIGTAQSSIINGLSSAFVRIYGQAEIAENTGLDEIAGVGYRRSLEFLLKDYLVSVHPDPTIQDDIRKQFLGNCIEKYVKNDNLRSVAKRAVWLGNDETHYVRRWEDKDIQDLKKLIRMTMNWIELEQQTLELQKEMPGPK